jgi:hypothetical protein
MSLYESLDRRARRLGIVDTKLAQGAAIFCVLIIVKLVPEILNLSVWWFVALAVACAVKPMLTFFGHRLVPCVRQGLDRCGRDAALQVCGPLMARDKRFPAFAVVGVAAEGSAGVCGRGLRRAYP